MFCKPESIAFYKNNIFIELNILKVVRRFSESVHRYYLVAPHQYNIMKCDNILGRFCFYIKSRSKSKHSNIIVSNNTIKFNHI